MTGLLLYVVWDPSVVAFHVGSFAVRWYSLLWLIGLIGAYFMVRWLFDDQKIGRERFEPLFLYCFIGILAGCRLGHCLFYEPSYFLTSVPHIIEMFLPIRFVDGGVKFTGYEGLASHGGTIGLILGMWFYSLRYKVSMWTVFDDIGIATPITACCIRLGNLMNSEIIGKVTDVPWAFVFEHVDMMPRHPSQLYEALAYFIFLFVGLGIYRQRKIAAGGGFYFGLCLVMIFAFRFFIEFTKEDQVDFEASMALNMGQLLSIPFVVFGSWCMWRGWHKMRKK